MRAKWRNTRPTRTAARHGLNGGTTNKGATQMPTPNEQQNLLHSLVVTKLAYDEAVRNVQGAVVPGVYSVLTDFGRVTYHVQVFSFTTPDVRGPVRKL